MGPRNRLKVYQGLYCVAIRDFKQAAELFLDTVSTFTSYELMDYKTFVTYTVYVSMIALERPDLREKVIKGAEILEVLHSLPAVRQYLFSLYECRYSVFFQSLAIVEQEMKKDWLFCTSLSILRKRNANSCVQPAAGIVQVINPGLYGRSFWCWCGVH